MTSSFFVSSPLLVLLAVLAVALRSSFAQNVYPSPVYGTYFPNWAQYTAAPYTFTPANLAPIISKLNVINYAFAYFCPTASMIQPYWVLPPYSVCNGKQPFQITNIEYDDAQFYRAIVAYKQQNPALKVMLSVGGWNFPSHFWSVMVSSAANRQVFIASAVQYMAVYGFDGIDIDWEYPASAPRTDEVRISCEEFRPVTDLGGSPNDRANLLLLVQEMRQAFGTQYLLTVATQADIGKAKTGFDIAGMTAVIDAWNLMTYDYSVSAELDTPMTAPNQPLFNPGVGLLPNDSVSTTIDGYLANGATADKLVVGVAFYGHTWYVPGLTGNTWQTYGHTGMIQGECCGPLKNTYGGKYAKYYEQCGSYMYSMTMAAGFEMHYDNKTGTNIGYMQNTGKDGWTAEGIWVTFQGKECIQDLMAFAKSRNIRGAFSFDVTQDSYANGFDFELTTEIYNAYH